jgi:hypothetical protein
MVRAAQRLLGTGLFLSVVITLGGCGGTSATPSGAAAFSPTPSQGASSSPGAGSGTPGSGASSGTPGSGPVTSPPPNPTPAPQPTPTSVETIYVPTSATTGIGASGYNIDPNSGQLKKIGDFTSARGFGGYSSDPQHRIYISNNGSSDCYKGYCTMDTQFSTLVRNTATGVLTVGMDGVLVPKRFNGIAILPSRASSWQASRPRCFQSSKASWFILAERLCTAGVGIAMQTKRKRQRSMRITSTRPATPFPIST